MISGTIVVGSASMFFRSKKGESQPPVDKAPEPKTAQPVAATNPVGGQPSTSGVKQRVAASANGIVGPKILANRPVVVRRVRAATGYDPALGMLTHLFMQSDEHQHLRLSDLSWLALPALRAKQVMIAVTRGKGQVRPNPTGAVLWASVSADVDRRLSRELDRAVQLQPQDWKSGDILWIVAVAGGHDVTMKLIRKLIDGPPKGRAFKMRGRGPDGTAKVVVIDPNQTGKTA